MEDAKATVTVSVDRGDATVINMQVYAMSIRTVRTLGTLLLVFGLLALVACRPDDREGVEKDDGESGALEEELERLPHEFVIRGRTVVFDTESVEAESPDEFAQLPYEVETGNETRRVEADIALESDEAPIEFIERFIDARMPPQEELDMYPETMYQYTVSLYRIEQNHGLKRGVLLEPWTP